MNIDDLINKFKKNAPSEILGVKVNPEALAYITIGNQAFEQNNYAQAITYFSKAIELDPKNWHSHYKRGDCYKLTQKFDKALEDLLKSKALDDNFDNNQSIAECYLLKKDYLIAVGYFNTTIKKLEKEEAIDTGKMMGINYGATKARVLNNQAVCYFHLQQLDQAIDCTTKGIRANPNYPNNYSIRGMSYLQQGNRTQAINDLQFAARLGDPRANAILSQI